MKNILFLFLFFAVNVNAQAGGGKTVVGRYPNAADIAEGCDKVKSTVTGKWYYLNSDGTTYTSADSFNISKASYVADTANLLAKRDTAKFAEGIRKSVSTATANTGYYSVSDIFSTTTLTASSAEYIRSSGTITIQLPNPVTCVSGGLYRKFTIIKGDLGINTLTITDHNGSTLATETSKGVVRSFICLGGSIWIQLQ